MERDQVALALQVDLEALNPVDLPETRRALEQVVKQAQPDLKELNEVAARIARQRAAAQVADLTVAKRKVVRTLVARALHEGWSDAVLRRRIDAAVGLDARYTTAVETYRKGLTAQGMPPGRANREADAYARRLRRYRAQVIAHHETQWALLEAQREQWSQQQADHELSRYAVRVFRVHKDERTCPVCRPMHGQRASLKPGATYARGISGPPLHPNCRCYEVVLDEGLVKTDPRLWGW